MAEFRAHDVAIKLAPEPENCEITIDGARELSCRSISVHCDLGGWPIVMLELYADKVTIGGVADVIEMPAKEGRQIIEHKSENGPGVVRHLKLHRAYCRVCSPDMTLPDFAEPEPDKP